VEAETAISLLEIRENYMRHFVAKNLQIIKQEMCNIMKHERNVISSIRMELNTN
jgi:hypothetical protein